MDANSFGFRNVRFGCTIPPGGELCFMLLFRERVPPDWLSKVMANLPAVLVDHAHLERKAATSAINLEKYRDLFPRVGELNAIAIEELQHFQLVLGLLKERGIPFAQPYPSPWIKGLMKAVRSGERFAVIDHLISCSLIEGRSCEKFQILSVRIAVHGREARGILRRPGRIRRQSLRDVPVDGARYQRTGGAGSIFISSWMLR